MCLGEAIADEVSEHVVETDDGHSQHKHDPEQPAKLTYVIAMSAVTVMAAMVFVPAGLLVVTVLSVSLGLIRGGGVRRTVVVCGCVGRGHVLSIYPMGV